MHKHDGKILNHMKLIPYKKPCNSESITFWYILVKSGVGNENCFSHSSSDTVDMDIKFRGRIMHQSIMQALPSPPKGKHVANLQNFTNKFYTFPPLQDINYLNIYKFVWRTYIYQLKICENCKLLN